ncbi:MAG TPA: hypothetical protein VEQ66_07695 [Propionibacteriaceae bacterium]|nr:hypothetical protein [Propionibacteriaceae bacterium]
MKWVRKVFVIIFAVFALFYLITRPEDAAAAVRTVFTALASAFQSIIVFFTSLAG